MMITSESKPPRSSGSVAFTASWKQTWVLQLPNSPKNSTMLWLSSPPASSSSKAWDPVVSLVTALRLSRMSSPVSNPPMSAQSFAPSMISAAFFSPISQVSASSLGDATAIAMSSVYPASRSFSAMAGPTPGMSSSVFVTISILSDTTTANAYISGTEGVHRKPPHRVDTAPAPMARGRRPARTSDARGRIHIGGAGAEASQHIIKYALRRFGAP